MKIKDFIHELNKLDPNMDILFPKTNWASELSVDADLIGGYSVRYSHEHNPLGTRPPAFVDNETAHKICEDGRSYLDFKSKYIKPAIYLKSVEPNYRAAYQKYLRQSAQLKLFQEE